MSDIPIRKPLLVRHCGWIIMGKVNPDAIPPDTELIKTSTFKNYFNEEAPQAKDFPKFVRKLPDYPSFLRHPIRYFRDPWVRKVEQLLLPIIESGKLPEGTELDDLKDLMTQHGINDAGALEEGLFRLIQKVQDRIIFRGANSQTIS